MVESSAAIICLGANGFDKHDAVAKAYSVVAAMGSIVGDSGAYPTPAENTPANAEPYNNRVICLTTKLSLDELYKSCKEYEGRERQVYKGDGVAIDIDIVVFNGKVLREQDYRSRYFIEGLKLMNEMMLQG